MAGFAGTSKRGWLILAGFFLALLALDSATKIWNSTPDWGMHVVPTPWWALLGPVIFLLGALWKVTRIWVIIGAAGALGNSAWAYNAEGVPNPWVANVEGKFEASDLYLFTMLQPSTVAFNTADVFIWIAQVGIVISSMVWSYGVIKREWRFRAYRNPARRARYDNP